MNQDVIFVVYWWLLFLVLGVISLPVAWLFFRKFTDIGFAFAKTTGLLFVSFVIFVAATFHLLSFTNLSLWLIVALWLAINYAIFRKNKAEFIKSIKASLGSIILTEILFSFGLFLWSYVRAFQPDIRGLEKFMDFGFINSILASKYFPPADMWAAGESINYYWFGHLTAAAATKLSSIPPAVTYNLMLGTILGFLLCGAFSLVSTLIGSLGENFKKKAVIAGLISAILIAFAGNFHTPVYLLKSGVDKYWYPNATRFIGYDPDTPDKTIHEFPMYSFVVSDLHGHVLNIPFVVLYLAFLWKLASDNEPKESLKKRVVALALPGAVLGVMFATSTWDFANYLLATGMVLGLFKLFEIRHIKYLLDGIIEVSSQGIILLIIALTTIAPFILHFSSIAQGINLVQTRTPLWQLAILWGLPLLLIIIFVTFIIAKLKFKPEKSDIFILALLITSLVLIILPEIIYVKDIYTTQPRANTMFKLTYQAFIMAYLASGYVAIRIIAHIKKFDTRFVAAVFFVAIFASLLYYPFIATKAYYNGLKFYQGLSGNTWMKSSFPEYYAAVGWLKKNAIGQPVILEAPGDSYTDYNLVSAYTGFPTVSGWFVHEWLWRGTADFPQARVQEVSTVYNSPNSEAATTILQKYQVKYIIVGTNERQKYPAINETGFLGIAKKVFSEGSLSIYSVN